MLKIYSDILFYYKFVRFFRMEQVTINVVNKN